MVSSINLKQIPLSSDLDATSARSLRIGRYELVAQLAQGGMGTVYLARIAGEAGFSRLYALKLMHPHLASEEAFVGMFLDEARLAAGIHHSNVVSVVDLGVCERGHFVVMQYVEGCSLEQLFKRQRERPPDKIVPLVIDLLHGLHAAHTLRDEEGRPLELVHRDVSPANVLVGVDGVGRITDFGIAKARSRITATRPGMLKGKISYSAPEQLTGERSIDARTDVFSAGVLLWSALTGKHLFRGDSDAQTIRNLLQMVVEPPSAVGRHPPKCFDHVCLRALERDPSRRFESALEMAEALRDVARDNVFLASSARIGAWVQETFDKELSERRTVLRELTSSARPSGVASTGLAFLPAIPGPGAAEGGSSPSVVSESFLSSAWSGRTLDAKRSRRSLVLALALLMTALSVGGGFAWWSASSQQVADAGLPERKTVASPADMVRSPAARQAELEQPKAIEKPTQETHASESAPAPSASPEPSLRGKSHPASAGVHRRQSTSARALAQSAESKSEPEKPAEPSSPAWASPAQEMDVNPYLRGQ